MAVFTKNSKLDTFYFLYFLIHIPITILVDSTIAVPPQYQLAIQKKVLQFHLQENKDFILLLCPSWLKVAGIIEVVFQLPVFFIGLYSLYFDVKKFYPWFLTYGFNASLTTLFCLYDIAIFRNTELTQSALGFAVSDADRFKLFWVYFPTFVIPLVIFVDFLFRSTKIIADAEGEKKAKKEN